MPLAKHWIVGCAMAALAGCASVPAPSSSPPQPDYSPLSALALPARGVLYTDCIAQAIREAAVTHHARGDVRLISFTCTGAPAQRFYEALAAAGEAAGSVWQAGGRTWRATVKVEKDLFGADYCSSAPQGGAVCQVVLNTGPFLTPPP